MSVQGNLFELNLKKIKSPERKKIVIERSQLEVFLLKKTALFPSHPTCKFIQKFS